MVGLKAVVVLRMYYIISFETRYRFPFESLMLELSLKKAKNSFVNAIII